MPEIKPLKTECKLGAGYCCLHNPTYLKECAKRFKSRFRPYAKTKDDIIETENEGATGVVSSLLFSSGKPESSLEPTT